jgi:hypothetical protein
MADKAAADWNRVGARVELVRAPGRRRADYVIRKNRNTDCSGTMSTSGRLTVSRGCPNKRTTAQVIAHEFGHIFFFHHENRRCSLMNAVIYSECRGKAKSWRRCRYLTKFDAWARARRFGKNERGRKTGLCR